MVAFIYRLPFSIETCSFVIHLSVKRQNDLWANQSRPRTNDTVLHHSLKEFDNGWPARASILKNSIFFEVTQDLNRSTGYQAGGIKVVFILHFLLEHLKRWELRQDKDAAYPSDERMPTVYIEVSAGNLKHLAGRNINIIASFALFCSPR